VESIKGGLGRGEIRVEGGGYKWGKGGGRVGREKRRANGRGGKGGGGERGGGEGRERKRIVFVHTVRGEGGRGKNK